jgi:hypothetical protein
MVNADSPADTRASQHSRRQQNCALDAFVSQKTETKERQNRGCKGHDCAVNRTQKRNACPEPIDMEIVQRWVHVIERIDAASWGLVVFNKRSEKPTERFSGSISRVVSGWDSAFERGRDGQRKSGKVGRFSGSPFHVDPHFSCLILNVRSSRTLPPPVAERNHYLMNGRTAGRPAAFRR